MNGWTGDRIMFKKVNKKVLKHQTDRINEKIKYLKSKIIAKTSKLIRGANVWVTERIGLKNVEHRKKK